MSLPTTVVPPLQMRRRIYLALLTAGLLAGFGGAVWSTKGHSVPGVDLLTVGFVIAAAGTLLWLRPRPRPYAVGLVCMLLAFLDFWLASPVGWRWVADSVLRDPSSRLVGRQLLWWLFLFFPVGWLLLAASVADWKLGLLTYLLAGVVFTLFGAGWLGPPGVGPGRMPAWAPIALLLLWPQYTLLALGVFGSHWG